MASWKLSRVPVLDDEQPAPFCLSERDLEELTYYKVFYHLNFAQAEIRQLRFQRWRFRDRRQFDA
jgi:hypothetical protein